MSKETMKLALEAGFSPSRQEPLFIEMLERFEDLVRADERAKLAQQEPCGWQFYHLGKWHNGMETNNHRANTEAAGIPVRDVYPSPQPAQRKPLVWLSQEEEQQIKHHCTTAACVLKTVKAKLKDKNNG
jgi:hypothetical protein